MTGIRYLISALATLMLIVDPISADAAASVTWPTLDLPIDQIPDAMSAHPEGPPLAYVTWPDAGELPRTTLIEVPADPSKGFHFPYLLILPEAQPQPLPVIVETNNDGEADVPYGTHFYWALHVAKYRHLIVASTLKAAVFVPIFPRFSNRLGGKELYMHALTRSAISTRVPQLRRIDLQLEAMIADLRQRLADRGVKMMPKVLLNGFSASGQFALRWTMIHPQSVCAVAAGGFGGLPTLPMPRLGRNSLQYPLGTKDWSNLFGEAFDVAAYRLVPQLFYLGDRDTNNSVTARDSYTARQERTVRQTVGMNPQARFSQIENLFKKNGFTNIRFMTVADTAHSVPKKQEEEIVRFFGEQLASGACNPDTSVAR